jgi:putative transposase
MPNHFHFLLRQDSVVPLSRFVGLVFNAYVQAVNKQQNRHGPLFENRFKHSRIDRQEYLIHLCRYIHLNPVRAGLAGSPGEWPYSDYPEWVGDRAAWKYHAAAVSSNLRDSEDYRRFVLERQENRDAETMLRVFLMD